MLRTVNKTDHASAECAMKGPEDRVDLHKDGYIDGTELGVCSSAV